MTRRTVLLLLAALSGGAPGVVESQGVQGITYAEQPTGIELRAYAATWPALDAYARRLEASDRAAVKTELKERAAGPTASDGELNLLAQLEREAVGTACWTDGVGAAFVTAWFLPGDESDAWSTVPITA